MKNIMTKGQIDEINQLLENHGSALTAFYDEGILAGANAMRKYTVFVVILTELTIQFGKKLIKWKMDKRRENGEKES